MNTRRFLFPVVALLVLALAAACGFSVSTANVKSAVLSRGYENGDAVDPTTTFAPTDQTIHLVVKVGNAPDGTTLKAIWYIVEVQGSQPGEIDQTSLTLNSGQDTADFTLSNNQAWPAGKYKVELYLNDKLNQPLEFEVQS